MLNANKEDISLELKNSMHSPNSDIIWEEFSMRLKNFIRKRISNQQDAEDILQEVFYKIHNKIDDIKDYHRIHAWIFKLTGNAIVDYYRKKDSGFVLTEITQDFPAVIEEDLSVNEEIAKCLHPMIDQLPEKYRQAITLTEFEKITQKELAQRLGISISGAKSRVQRARLMLKDTLLDCCHLEFDHLGNVIDYKHKTTTCKFC